MKKSNNDNLFMTDYYLPIFETQELAEFYGLAGALQATSRSDKDLIKTCLKVAEKDYKIKVVFSNPGDIVLKIDEVIKQPSDRIFWHVLIGDKAGWIIWKRDCIKRIKNE